MNKNRIALLVLLAPSWLLLSSRCMCDMESPATNCLRNCFGRGSWIFPLASVEPSTAFTN